MTTTATLETLEARRLLAGDDLLARSDQLTTKDLSSDEVAAIVAEADADDSYARTSWGAENHWFQASDGSVYSLWHGGAVHDPDGDGRFRWHLTDITEAAGLPSGFKPGSLSGTFTPWRAMNIVGLDDDGRLVTYWWSPESGERSMGARGNGWCLTDLTGATDFSEVNGGGGAEHAGDAGFTVTRMAGPDGHTIQIIVDDDFADDRTIVISFTPSQPSRDGSPWVARHISHDDLRRDHDDRDRDDDGRRRGRDDDDHRDRDRGRGDHDNDNNGELVLFGDVTIEEGETVTRNIRIIDGTLTVLGTVSGNIRQIGDGSVTVADGGLVTGNIRERGDGDITIIDAFADGNLHEQGDGSIAFLGDSIIRGNAQEHGPGGIDIDAAATVSGNIDERDGDRRDDDDHDDDRRDHDDDDDRRRHGDDEDDD